MRVPWYLMAKGKGGGGYKTASGPIVSISDALAAPLRSLRVGIDPVQDLHGYDSPWPAGGGVNKLLPSDIDTSRTVQEVTATWNASNEELTLNGSNSGSYAIVIDFAQYQGHISFPDLQVGDTWSFSANLPTGAYIGIVYKNTSNQDIQYWYILGDGTYKKVTLKVPDAFVSFLKVQVGVNPNASFSNAKIKIAFESGSGSSVWTPYSNICPISGWDEANVWVKPTYDPTAEPTVTIQLGQTVYGATLDVTTGVLTVDRAMVDLGTLDWTYDSTRGYFRTNSITGIITGKPYSALICDQYATKAGVGQPNADCQIAQNSSGGLSTSMVNIKDTRYTDATVFTAALDGVKAVYELATPITIPLTPQEISTLQGANNLWADTGDSTVEYLSAGGANPDLMKLAVAFMGRR